MGNFWRAHLQWTVAEVYVSKYIEAQWGIILWNLNIVIWEASSMSITVRTLIRNPVRNLKAWTEADKPKKHYSMIGAQ